MKLLDCPFCDNFVIENVIIHLDSCYISRMFEWQKMSDEEHAKVWNTRRPFEQAKKLDKPTQ